MAAIEPTDLPALAEVRGSFTVAGEQHPVDALGWQQTQADWLGANWNVLHLVAVWFSREDGLALSALYPAPASRGDEATITAAVLGAERSTAEDPRLSTTYGREGRVLRAGIELWLARGEDDDLYPLRASGESVGPELGWTDAGISFEAQPFRWHSREREGPGLYLRSRR